MQLKFYINYVTRFGENLFVNLNGDEYEMLHYGNGRWMLELTQTRKADIEYFYLVRDANGNEIAREWGKNRHLTINKNTNIYDLWQQIDANKPFYSSAFTNIVNRRDEKKDKASAANQTIKIIVRAPQIESDKALAVCGNSPALGNWDKPIRMNGSNFPTWEITLDAKKMQFPIEYKFVIIDKNNKITEWEYGKNKQLYAEFIEDKEENIYEATTSLGENKNWRGSGTAIPIFSLRTAESFGIGDFADLKKMIDWVKATGQNVLQTLPINDTCMFFDRRDSYPYRANSIYALHPIYISPKKMGKINDAEKQKKYDKIQKELNALAVVDYDKVISEKWNFFKDIFAQDGDDCLKTDEYKEFFNRNKFWLEEYAAFCVLRDKFKTPDFTQWKEFAEFAKIEFAEFAKKNAKAMKFYYFLQFFADKQMREATEYARKNGVILKGDIPIGISRQSVESWTEPQLFNMTSQAGAPPDDFSVDGQNWGFPTYNWDAMRADGYQWWIRRFKKMADYFDAYRIDHVLGFFRIWEIPLNSVQGLLGYFNPALPYSYDELAQRGLPMDENRFLKPYIRCHLLGAFFGKYDNAAYKTFFNQTADDILELKPEFDSQRKVESYFANKKQDEQNTALKNGLFGLINNVLFIEDPVKHGHFHPRISAQLSYTFAELNDWQKQAFNRLYDEFYYYRNTDFWKTQAMEKLPMLVRATDMLVCGEDLGMIPHCVPDVMNYLQILSLEIQRMPKDVGVDFGNTDYYPYHSVCTTSTHDMSPLRLWWKEDHTKTQKYYNQVLHQDGAAPEICSGNIVEQIMTLHLNSPSMLAVFPLQDWLGIDEKIRRKNEDEERINVPANPNNYWQYRMHINIEKLLKEKDFNNKIKILANRNK